MELTIKEMMMKRLETEQACVIQLEMGAYDYSLSEIARIVEEDDARILALTMDPVEEDPGRIMVSLLVNKSDCGAILQSFYRYNYHVVNTFSSPDEDGDLFNRYSLLMRYLNV
ncbi:MAG: hypothetical protein IKT08_03795 [Bacteroidales bacterium]|nr:hypothetical protein [Bacteroidales bacterium]